MLERKYRLRQGKDFQAVYGNHDAVAASTVVLYIKDTKMDGGPRVGFSVSKKLGGAVVRNRCRRVLQEILRRHIHEIKPGRDYVFIGRGPLAGADSACVERDVMKVLSRKGCLRKQDG
ncbi:MAG: ribonuclease P protein component [Clostridiales bacterium]|nr:ribonuclease P protein component [Clostridiales bacterium]